jgi:hypothetical protein
MTQLRVVAQEVDHLGAARAELLRGLSVGKDDRLSLLRHFQIWCEFLRNLQSYLKPCLFYWVYRIV